VAEIVGSTVATGTSIGDTASEAVTEIAAIAAPTESAAAEVVESVSEIPSAAISTVGPLAEDFFEDAISDVALSEPIGQAAPSLLPAPGTVEIVLDGAQESAAAASQGGFVGSGGVIAFAEPPIIPVAPDDLFVGGAYTERGIAVSAPASEATASSSTILNPVPVEATEAPADEHDDPLIPVIPIAPLTAALDDLSLRGGDGLL
jgi:hypothetical protein